jgi:hypothetical protein
MTKFLKPTIPQADLNANTFDGDWVKEHRKIQEHKIWQDPVCYQVWRFMIMEAKWADDVYSDGRVRIHLKRGQLVCSLTHLCKNLPNMDRNTANSKTRMLQRLNTIETEVKQGLRVITILNYDSYQCTNIVQKTELKQICNTDETEMTPSKELRTKNKELTNKSLAALTPLQGALVRDWIEFTKKHSKTKIEPNPEAYAKSVLDLDRLAGVPADKLRSVLSFVEHDDFWRPNALSLPRLLDKSKTNGLRKIENILQAMERKAKEERPGGIDWDSLRLEVEAKQRARK